jgi:hypothetical protein
MMTPRFYKPLRALSTFATTLLLGLNYTSRDTTLRQPMLAMLIASIGMMTYAFMRLLIREP